MEGYQKIADLMAHNNELLIFRKFQRLNAQNLLHLQADLVYLEKEWDDIAERDRQSGLADYDRDWISLRNSGGERLQKSIEIKKKLKEYSKSLLPSLSSLVSAPYFI